MIFGINAHYKTTKVSLKFQDGYTEDFSTNKE